MIIALIQRFILTLFLLTANVSSSYAAPALIGLRTNEAEVRQQAESSRQTIIQKSAIEFANGNTFVRLLESVENKEVELLIPAELSSDSLMEALLTVFTLKKQRATRIIVGFSSDNPTITLVANGERKSIDLERWLAASGANEVRLSSGIRPIKNFQVNRANRQANSSGVVTIGSHDHLAAELAGLLNSELIQSLSRKTIAGRSIKLVAPAPEPVNETFVRSLLAVQQLKRLGASSVELITPYLSYARSDKVDQSGIAVAGKLVANLIEASGVDSVSFVRSHAPQSEGFFNIPTRNISGRETLNVYLRRQNIQAIVSPDAGFQKDATLYADELGLPVGVINKQRDPLTSETRIVGMSGPDLRNMRVAIIDDETASGSTLAKAAEYLKSRGALEVFAVVTHLTGSASAALNSDALKKVVVTNSLPIQTAHPKLEVLSIAPEIAFAIGSQASIRSCLGAFANNSGKNGVESP